MPKWYDGLPWAQPAQQAPTMPDGVELETSTPARAADLIADLVTPLGQAAVTGILLGGLLTFALAVLLPDIDVDPLKVFGFSTLAISAGVWLILLADHRRLLWALERVIGRDLDRDGATGEPQERVIILNADRAQREAEQRENARRASQFARFVAALPTRGTAMDDWTELRRETYQEYRDALIRLGWARWNSTKRDGTPNKKQGWALTLPAEEILKRIS